MSDVSSLTDRHDATATEPGLARGALPETGGAIATGPLAGPKIESDEVTLREKQVEEDLLYLTGLVFGRAILEQRGAGNAELAWMTSEITKLRERLAGERQRPYTIANSEA